MARHLITRIDRFINFLTITIIIGGGFFIHMATALTIRSYYGEVWGYISFLLPGFAELYLVGLQISQQMYNYTIILAGFLTAATALTLSWHFKNSLMTRISARASWS